jgi:rhodanese-related sulfurtransferase
VEDDRNALSLSSSGDHILDSLYTFYWIQYIQGGSADEERSGACCSSNTKVATVPVGDDLSLLRESGTVFVDLRDSAELFRDGKIPGAVNVDRGALEFPIDPASPNHDSVFDSGAKLVTYCVTGGRSALTADTAQQMGLQKVAYRGGGFKAWSEAGGAVEKQ